MLSWKLLFYTAHINAGMQSSCINASDVCHYSVAIKVFLVVWFKLSCVTMSCCTMHTDADCHSMMTQQWSKVTLLVNSPSLQGSSWALALNFSLRPSSDKEAKKSSRKFSLFSKITWNKTSFSLQSFSSLACLLKKGKKKL